jgi:hypothetical protein
MENIYDTKAKGNPNFESFETDNRKNVGGYMAVNDRMKTDASVWNWQWVKWEQRGQILKECISEFQ